jgi:hypothetical protein
MRNRWEYAGTTSDQTQRLISILVKSLNRFPNLVMKLKSLIDAADFHIWVRATFHQPKYFSTKTDLIREILNTMESDSWGGHSKQIIELGVAYGDTLRITDSTALKDFPKVGGGFQREPLSIVA